jgi:ribonuclease HII
MTNRKRILVHACCASCASYVVAHLAGSYDVSVFFYNPNIQPAEEYDLRLGEMRTVCRRFGVDLMEGAYDPGEWRQCIDPYRHLPERSERCWSCYGLRLDRTAERAARLGIDLFTTTLSVSPHKVHRRIVEAGRSAAARFGVRFHEEDFKKHDGFKCSVERSKELGLTRQDYCGCPISLEEAKERRKRK